MALSTAAAVKQWLETMGLGLPVFNRLSSIPRARPYITIVDGQPTAPGTLEDGGPGACVETCMVDVWQDRKQISQAGGTAEDSTLVPRLLKLLQGGRPTDAGGHPILVDGAGGSGVVYRVRVVSDHKMTDPSTENLVHNALTLALWRQM
jgi:hypothetical protein